MVNLKSVGLSPSFLFRKRLRRLLPQRWHARLERLERSSRVYIVPTLMGMYFAFIALVLFLIAISYGHNLAYYATFLFFSFVSLSAIIANNNITKVEVSWPRIQFRGRVGEDISVPLILINRSQFSRYDIKLEVNGVSVAHVDELKPLTTQEVVLNLKDLNLKRGHFKLKRLTLATRFPFALFYAWNWSKIPIEVFIHPAPKPSRLKTVVHDNNQSGGELIAKNIGSEEFFVIREHRAGEGLFRIDHRLSLRLDRPQVREYRDQTVRSFLVDLRGGESERSLAEAVDWLDQCSNDSECGFILPDGRHTRIFIGRNNQQNLYDELARFGQNTQELE